MGEGGPGMGRGGLRGMKAAPRESGGIGAAFGSIGWMGSRGWMGSPSFARDRDQPSWSKTARSWARAQSTSSAWMTKGGAMRMVWLWVSLHKSPRCMSASQ